MDKPVMIVGAGGLGKTALDIFLANDVLVYGFLDDDKSLHNTDIQEVTILGSIEDDAFFRIIGDECEVCIAVEDMAERERLATLIQKKRKKMPMNMVHPVSVLEQSASLEHGNFIGAGVYVGSAVQIGNHCLIHAQTTLNYEVKLADYVYIGTGTVLNSGVQVGEKAFIGSGVTITSNIKIGANAKILAGSVVMRDVPEGETVFGVPAQKVQ